MTYWPGPQSSGQGVPDPHANPFGEAPQPTAPGSFQGAGQPFWTGDPSSFGLQTPPVYQAGYQAPPPPPEPPRKKRRTALVLALVAVVALAAAGVGAGFWWLNRGGSEGGPGPGSPKVAALPAPPPPLGDLRPPANVALPSLEQPIEKPLWTYQAGIDEAVLGGDAHTVVIGSDQGVIALEAATGVPRWSEPVKPPNININEIRKGKCVITRDATTVGCILNLNLSTGQPEVLGFYEVATGRTLYETTMPGGTIDQLYASGDGIALIIEGELISYRSDGSEAWRIKHDGVAVYGDQGIIFTKSSVLDANSGNPIVQGIRVDTKIAFTSGFAFSQGNTIDFYNFRGDKTASVASAGFRLLDNVRSYQDVRDRRGLYNSSGFYVPLAYNESTGELRAYDGTSGSVLWTRPTGEDFGYSVAGFGSDTTCLIATVNSNEVGSGNMRVKAQTCRDDSANPFVPVSMLKFLGSDGTRFLMMNVSAQSRELVCVDAATGNELWHLSTTDFPDGAWVAGGAYSWDGKTITRWI